MVSPPVSIPPWVDSSYTMEHYSVIKKTDGPMKLESIVLSEKKKQKDHMVLGPKCRNVQKAPFEVQTQTGSLVRLPVSGGWGWRDLGTDSERLLGCCVCFSMGR